MPRLKHTKKFLHPSRRLLIVSVSGIFSVALVITATIFFLRQPHKLQSISSETAAPKIAKPEKTTATPSEQIVTQEQQPTNQPATTDHAPSSRQIAPQTRTNTPPPDALLPLMVIGFSANTYASCSGLGFSYAYININQSAAGTIHWQIEARQSGAVSVIGAGDITIAERTGAYQLGNLEQYKVPLKSDDSAIRLHITSPNDIASAWFTPDYKFATCSISY